jgi:hypothetical protein
MLKKAAIFAIGSLPVLFSFGICGVLVWHFFLHLQLHFPLQTAH